MDFKLPFFSRGEISPRLYGRVDTAAYQSGLKTARNVIVGVGGSVFNRPGTICITPTKYYDRPNRLIPFTFNSQDTCMLEFGDFYMRVLREDFPQLDLAPKAITGITKGPVTTLTVVAHGYANGDEVIPSDIVGTVQLNEGHYVVASATTDTFVIKGKVSGLDIDSTLYDDYVSGGEVDRIYEIATPYAASDLALIKFTQSADVLTLVHTEYPIKDLQRVALNDWRLVDPVFVPLTQAPANLLITVEGPASTTVSYAVTAINKDTGVESLSGSSATTYQITAASNTNPIVVETSALTDLQDGDDVYIDGVSGMTEINGKRFTVQNVNAMTFELRDEDGTDYGVFTSATTDSLKVMFIRVTNSNDTSPFNILSWDAVPDTVQYSIYKDDSGLFGYIGSTKKLTFTDDNIDADTGVQPPQMRNIFVLPDDYPGAVGYHQQRRIYAGSNNHPDTWDASKIGDYDNFSTSFPLKDDDAINFTLASGQVNQIKHIISDTSMALFTTGQEWSVSSGGEIAFSPLTAKADPETNWGCADHRPFVVGKTVVFVQQDNRTVRSFGFDYETARPWYGLKSNDLSTMSDHIFNNDYIVDWSYARTPYSAMVMTSSNGHAACMVFSEEQNVIGWTRWDTRGTFESVAVVRVCVEHETPEPDDGIYFTVSRRVNGRTVKFIERLHKRRFLDVRDAFFVDCGRSWDRPKQITDVVVADLFQPVPFDTLMVTGIGHGYADDMVVDISDVRFEPNVDSMGNEVMPQVINDQQFIVTVIDDDTFALRYLADPGLTFVKSGDFADFQPYLGPGAARQCTDTIDNLDHLEGETVSVLANGYPLRGMVVENGSITLPGLAGRVHVGLPYTSDVELLDIEPNMGSQTIQGRFKKISRVTARFERSREMLIGPNSNALYPMKRAPYVDQSAQLYTGDREIILSPSWNSNGRVFFRMIDPLPFNLLAVFPNMEIS